MTVTLKRLGDIATYVNGYAFKPTDWKNKGLPIIRIQNLTNPDSPFNYYQGEIDDKYIVNKGDILISWSASLGVFEWLGEKAVLNQHIFKVIFDKEDIDKSYFKYIVQRSLERALKYLHGSTMKHITKKYFDNILVPIPDLVTQKKIAKVLDKAQELIDKRKAQIEALDQLTQSVFLEMFGDPIKNTNQYKKEKLANLCIKITDGTHHSPPTVKEGIPYITAKHLNKGGLDFFKDPTYVSLEDHQKIYERCNPEKGDVLYIKDGATTGIAAINHYDFEFSMLSSLALIKVDFNKLNNYYLTHFLNNERVFRKITSGMNGGAIKRLTLKKLTILR